MAIDTDCICKGDKIVIIDSDPSRYMLIKSNRGVKQYSQYTYVIDTVFPFSILNNRLLSALSCFFVLDKGLILPFRVRHKGSPWYWLCSGTVYSSVSDCRWISRGVAEISLSNDTWTDARTSLPLSISDGNFWWSIKYVNAGSNWTKAAIHQMHCAAKRYCRSLKVINNFAKVQSIISASLLKVILIEGAVLPLQS